MTVATAQFLDPRVLARISNLELLARSVVSGFINGLHRSPSLGMSLDFAEHRPYMPGDDIRRVDWRLYARTDRHFVKEFEADTNTNFVVLLDVSRSMSYAGTGVPKLHYARMLAASLAWFAREQRDRVGLVTFDADVAEFIPPSARHLEVVLHALGRVSADQGRQGSLAPALLRVADRLPRRGIVALISDLYEEPEAVVDALKPLRARGQDLIVFHLLDPSELDLAFDEATNFEELETGERLPVVPEAIRAQYRQRVNEHVSTLQRTLGSGRIDYAMLDTSTPLDVALFHFLSSRQRLSRVR